MNGSKALKISIVIIVLVVSVYFLVDTFIYSDKQARVKYQNFSQQVSRTSKISTEGTDPAEVSLSGILINLKGGQYHYLKADMSFKMKDKNDKSDIQKNIQQVRDLVLRYTTTIDSSQLVTTKGKEEYKQGLKKVINDTFGYKIEDIYFRNFVLAE